MWREVGLTYGPGHAGVSMRSVYPLTSSWPHLRCDVGLEEGEYK